MKILKVHKVKQGFTWFTLCGTYSNANIQPTKDDNKVTCKLCKKRIGEGKEMNNEPTRN